MLSILKSKTIFCISLIGLLLSSCDNVNTSSKLLRNPGPLLDKSSIRTSKEGFVSYRNSVNNFSFSFVEEYIKNDSTLDNICLSPISLYSSLAIAGKASKGETQKEILDVLGSDSSTLNLYYPQLFSLLNFERYTETLFGQGDIYSREHISNSIWLNNSISFKDNCLDDLANNFYCHSYSTDFTNNNQLANDSISDFVEKETSNLLKPNFEFDSSTLFVILSCLYLKDLWKFDGSDMSITSDMYEFTNADKTTQKSHFMQDLYKISKPFVNEKFTSFYVTAYGNTKVTFIVPNGNYMIKDLANKENLLKAFNYDYNGFDEKQKIIYHTRCLFPSFEAFSDVELSQILRALGIKKMFTNAADFSSLTNDHAFVNQVKHISKINVDRKGIEGASVTAIQACGSAGPIGGYTEIYQDFVVDRSFAYIISTNNIPVFSGIINHADCNY